MTNKNRSCMHQFVINDGKLAIKWRARREFSRPLISNNDFLATSPWRGRQRQCALYPTAITFGVADAKWLS